MSNVSTQAVASREAGKPSRKFDIYVMMPILACAYVEIISPLLLSSDLGPRLGPMWNALQQGIIMEPRLEHKLFWPGLAVISIALVIRRWKRINLPPHIICLFVYLGLAGVSVLWAFKPEFSSVRFIQQAMIIISIVLPAQLAAQSADMMRGVFLCFALALIANLFFVFNQPPMVIENVRISYPGYFTFKGLLGECAAVALLLSSHEILYSGWRRVSGIIVIGLALYLVVLSDSNGSLALAFLAPISAGMLLFASKRAQVSPAFLMLAVPVVYIILSTALGNLINRISWSVFGNYNLSGRTVIWDFANFEISRKPLFGWGYQSFWLVGPDAPSIVEAPGWVKEMPSSHNGYLDTMVDLGYIGLALLVTLIITTVYAIGRVADRDPARGWLLLTLALYVILTNFLETTWMHGMDMVWLIFLIVVAEAGRHWQSRSTSGLPLRAGKPPSFEYGPSRRGRRVLAG